MPVVFIPYSKEMVIPSSQTTIDINTETEKMWTTIYKLPLKLFTALSYWRLADQEKHDIFQVPLRNV